jgi:hypothetical protein
MHDRRHDRQQLVRLALDPVRQHGAQRAGRQAILASGEDVRFDASWPADRAAPRHCRRRAPHRQRERDAIAQMYPKVLRRVGGYNLDIFAPQNERPYTTTAASIWRICWSARKARSPISARSRCNSRRCRRTRRWAW